MPIDHWLNRQLQVWRKQATDDDHGGQVFTYIQVGTIRAKVDQPAARPSGSERVEAEQASAQLAHTIYANPQADVLRGDELRGGGQVFRVAATMMPSRPDYLKISAEFIQSEPEGGT